jgi:hypothetical protein
MAAIRRSFRRSASRGRARIPAGHMQLGGRQHIPPRCHLQRAAEAGSVTVDLHAHQIQRSPCRCRNTRSAGRLPSFPMSVRSAWTCVAYHGRSHSDAELLPVGGPRSVGLQANGGVIVATQVRAPAAATGQAAAVPMTRISGSTDPNCLLAIACIPAGETRRPGSWEGGTFVPGVAAEDSTCHVHFRVTRGLPGLPSVRRTETHTDRSKE